MVGENNVGQNPLAVLPSKKDWGIHMITEVGEYIVGSYLKQILKCDFVDYNVRPPGGGLKGLNELDVIGLHFKKKTAYLCEVTTHIRGLHYGTPSESIARIKKKYQNQKQYAKKYLRSFSNIHFMFWSPYVPVGVLTKGLCKLKGLELYINGRYKECITELMYEAADTTHDTRNPFFRMLQIVEHMRD